MPTPDETAAENAAAGTRAAETGQFDFSKIPEDAELDVTVRGQKVRVKAKDIPRFVQMGYRFSEGMEEVTRLKKEAETEKARAREDALREFEPQTRLMQFLDANPEKRRAIRMIVNDEAKIVPIGEESTEDGNGATRPTGLSRMELARLRDEMTGQINQTMQTVLSRIEKLGGTVTTLSERASDSEAIQYLKTNPATAPLATEEKVQDAKDYRREHGGTLVDAFRVVSWDDARAQARAKTIEEYGIDVESSSLPGSRPPVVDGVRLDDETLNRLFKDPDELAKHAKAIREHRRAMSGKQEAVRSGRR